jgi:hypothetical protein
MFMILLVRINLSNLSIRRRSNKLYNKKNKRYFECVPVKKMVMVASFMFVLCSLCSKPPSLFTSCVICFGMRCGGVFF